MKLEALNVESTNKAMALTCIKQTTSVEDNSSFMAAHVPQCNPSLLYKILNCSLTC